MVHLESAMPPLSLNISVLFHIQVLDEILAQKRLQDAAVNELEEKEEEENSEKKERDLYFSRQEETRQQAAKGWATIRTRLAEVKEERAAQSAVRGYRMFAQHARIMSDLQTAREDLYKRYGLYGPSEFMRELRIQPKQPRKAASGRPAKRKARLFSSATQSSRATSFSRRATTAKT